MAWLRSAPKTTSNDNNPKCRIETLADGHPAKRLPPANQYLCEAFSLCGCFKRSDMGGIIPLDWQEIDAFARRSGYDLATWESELIYKMSVEYCNINSKASDSAFPAPYRIDIGKSEEAIKAMNERVEKQLDSLFA
jgi:hypothetical protein